MFFFFFYELDELMENKINIYHIASESRPGEPESAHCTGEPETAPSPDQTIVFIEFLYNSSIVLFAM